MVTHVTVDARMVRISGIGTYLEELIPRIIARWERARFTLLGNTSELAQFASGDRVVVRHVVAPIYSAREQLALYQSIPRRTTLFWAPHYIIPLLHHGPLAVTVHDVNHLAIPQRTLARRLYARMMYGAARRRAAVVFCDSQFTAGEFRARVGDPRRLVVTHLGVSPRWFELTAGTAPIDRPYFLCIGNLKPHKNLARLLAAFERVAPFIEHRLVIVGRRDGLRTADDGVRELPAPFGDRVMFTGHVDRRLLEHYVACCDALVFPSLYEGFGLPPLEAMACGRAVAVSNAASLPEVCGPEADYFDPLNIDSIAASLEKLASRPPDTDVLRERRRAWARRYDWDRCADATVDALRLAAGV